jgi:predicted nucleotidyltransferase
MTSSFNLPQEQITRTVTNVGNGAHVFAPKEWINEKVLIVRLGKKDIKQEIIESLYPHLDKIIAIFLYGSHARGEATEDSDIDVLVIAKEKFKVEKKEKLEITLVLEENISKAIKLNPILMYSIFKEAKPILNNAYLEKLKAEKINKGFFHSFIEETKQSINSDKEILELDKETGSLASNSLIYSLVLRLRGILIVNQLLKNSAYSNKLFKSYLLENCKINYENIYNAYLIIRDNKEQKDRVSLAEAEGLLNFLVREIKKLTSLIK